MLRLAREKNVITMTMYNVSGQCNQMVTDKRTVILSLYYFIQLCSKDVVVVFCLIMCDILR